jgi:hypothetical protein
VTPPSVAGIHAKHSFQRVDRDRNDHDVAVSHGQAAQPPRCVCSRRCMRRASSPDVVCASCEADRVVFLCMQRPSTHRIRTMCCAATATTLPKTCAWPCAASRCAPPAAAVCCIPLCVASADTLCAGNTMACSRDRARGLGAGLQLCIVARAVSCRFPTGSTDQPRLVLPLSRPSMHLSRCVTWWLHGWRVRKVGVHVRRIGSHFCMC